MMDSLSAAIIKVKLVVSLGIFVCIGSQYATAQSLYLDFELLDAGTGKMVNLSKSEADFVVLISYAANCPFAAGYKTRIAELVKEFSSKQVQFMLINPNLNLALKAESVEEMTTHYRENKRDIPYLADENQRLTKILGFTKIPETVILRVNNDGMELVYKGAIDNNPQSAQHANQQYLRDALLALSQKKILKKETPVTGGCVIRKF